MENFPDDGCLSKAGSRTRCAALRAAAAELARKDRALKQSSRPRRAR